MAAAAAATTAGPDAPPGVIFVALHEHNEAVALRQDTLPADAEDVLNLLSSEAAPLLCWLDMAKAYLSDGQVTAFCDIVKEASSDDVLSGIRAYFNREPTFERVQLIIATAAYLTEAGRLERDAAARVSTLARAEALITEAEGVSGQEMLPAMARAALALARNPNDTAAALREYRRASTLLHNGRRNLAPLLAEAALHYHAGNLSAAIKLYADVLRTHPGCPPEVRLGIAACYYRAGKVEAATAAFNRVLELDPDCADALLGLAIIKFGSKDVQEGLNGGLQLLQRAFAADPAHPGVLCALSHFSLLKDEAAQALELAQSALDVADTDRLRGAALELLGRCHHALGDHAAAQAAYAQAIRLDPKAPLPHLGTAQVYLAAGGDPANVVSELELVLKALPGNGDALWLLGGLMPVLPERVAKTLSSHREAAARQVNDPLLQEILGELLASSEPAAALAAFEHAVAVYRARQASVRARNAARASRRAALGAQLEAAEGRELAPGQADELRALLAEVGEDEEVPYVPAQLLNNTAVLKYRSGDVSCALSLLQEATATMLRDGTAALTMVTLGFNTARLQEATGDLKSAAAAYQSLLSQFPGYIDCHLRLAALAKAGGDEAAAHSWAAAATRQAGGHVDAQALLAGLYLERGDRSAARECVARAQEAAPEARSDPYMALTHANVLMAALPAERISRLPPAEQARHKEHVARALAMYQAVLRAHPDNIYAVNGLGTCLAELGHTAAAREAFDEVVRATSRTKGFVRLPAAYLNLAHLALGRQAYADALRMYAHASKLHNHKNADILLCMARAHHDAGDHLPARACLLRALHLEPGNTRLQFNLGFVLQEWAVKVFKRSYTRGDASKLADYIQAAAALGQAERIFRHLGSLAKDATRLEPRKLAMHASFCANQLPKVGKMVHDAELEAEQTKAERVLRDAQAAMAAREREHQETLAASARRAQQQRQQEEARKALEEARARLEEARRKRQAEAAPDDGGDGGGKGRGRKRKKGAAAGGRGGEGDADDGQFFVDDAEPIERLPKPRRAAAAAAGGDLTGKEAQRAAGLDSDSDDSEGDYQPDAEAEAAAAAEAEELFGSDADDADAGGGGGGSDAAPRPQRSRGRLKRRGGEAGTDAEAGSGVGAAPAEDEEMADDWDAAGGGGGGDAADPGLGVVGEHETGGFEVDALFADADDGGGSGDDDAAGAEGGQQLRKRQRQRLGSDEEEDGAAAAEAPPAEPEPEGDLDDLFGDD